MITHTLYKLAMNIRGRQSEIGVQRSRHRVTNYNERARIDVEESRGNEEDDENETKWDEIEKKPRREETRVKGRRKKMKKLSGRSRVSNSAMAITSLLLRVVFRRLSTITGCFESERERARAHERDCRCLCVSRSLWTCIEKSRRGFLQIWQCLRLELLSHRRRRDMITEFSHVVAHISVFLNKDPSKIYRRGRCLMRERETHSGYDLL